MSEASGESMVGRRNMCAPTRLCDAMGADYAVTLLGKGVPRRSRLGGAYWWDETFEAGRGVQETR